ncbi:hypothetical protein CG018_04055 [Gemella sp. ND 6198]|uniref:LPXTG cell wall anchor domain-containing protein n=1 Tax=Gemella sp. ND 6198 TaxID=2040624 RepID=UPI000E0A70E0|nr:LPXTG cell wall anchor domain-containing protein [Gemella sp. ND 6198]AXI26643.1 hypothetical protein CG018_04055 [Gemella sp. ND 6198]
MKNNTLLKVLSATAIFSAIAAIEAYNQDELAYAAEDSAIHATTGVSTPNTTPKVQTTATTSTTTKQDGKNLKNDGGKKVTADNYEAATYKNPNKDREVDSKTVKKEFPLNVQGHLRNANNNDEPSLYEPALDNNVKVEKIGNKYKYTFRIKPGITDVGGEFYNFELSKIIYQDKVLELKTLSEKQRIKEASITSDKLLDKIQLDGTSKYPDGRDMSHFVTLQLYYETARKWEDRPIVEKDGSTEPITPKPTKPVKPEKPKEEPTPAKPIAEDHEAEANKVPNTFPTTVKGELNGRNRDDSSIYSNAFVKDVKVEKIGNKYQYTIQVKEGTSSNMLLRNKPFTLSKIYYKGKEIPLTEIDSTTKLYEGKIITDSLLDKIQLDVIVNVRVKAGAKPRYEDRTTETTLALNFPMVEKADSPYNSVPAKLLNANTDNLSMGNPALVSEKTRVEKIGDTYHYYVTFKDLHVGPIVGNVSRLTVNGKEAEVKDLGGNDHEKQYHFTSSEKLTTAPVTMDISVGGKLFHANTPARLSFDWSKATPLTKEQVPNNKEDNKLPKEQEPGIKDKNKLPKEEDKQENNTKEDNKKVEQETSIKEKDKNKTDKTSQLGSNNLNNQSSVGNISNNKKVLPNTGIATATFSGLGFLTLLSALIFRRKINK